MNSQKQVNMVDLNNVDLNEVKSKLYENLKASGWGDKLKTFILSSEFQSILENLLYEAQQGKRFSPPVKQIFRAFEQCPIDKVKVVFISQDVYTQPYVADGIPFSCSNTGRPESPLKYIFKAIEDTVYTEGYNPDPDLARWSNQGVLMLNCALTTTIHKIGAHYDLWKPFLSFLFDYLLINKPGLIYVFIGRKSEEWMDLLPEDALKLTVSHPASASYKELPFWDCKNIFNEINSMLVKQNNEKITW